MHTSTNVVITHQQRRGSVLSIVRQFPVSEVNVLNPNFLTELRRGTWGLLFLLPICPANGHYVLLAPIVCWCHLLDFRQSVTGLSRLLDPVSGTLCRGHNDISVTVSVLPTSQNLALQKVISGHHHLNLQLLIDYH